MPAVAGNRASEIMLEIFVPFSRNLEKVIYQQLRNTSSTFLSASLPTFYPKRISRGFPKQRRGDKRKPCSVLPLGTNSSVKLTSSPLPSPVSIEGPKKSRKASIKTRSNTFNFSYCCHYQRAEIK